MATGFLVNYEDAKKLLEVFYNSPYKNVLPYVEILHKMPEIDGLQGTFSFKERIEQSKVLRF